MTHCRSTHCLAPRFLLRRVFRSLSRFALFRASSTACWDLGLPVSPVPGAHRQFTRFLNMKYRDPSPCGLRMTASVLAAKRGVPCGQHPRSGACGWQIPVCRSRPLVFVPNLPAKNAGRYQARRDGVGQPALRRSPLPPNLHPSLDVKYRDPSPCGLRMTAAVLAAKRVCRAASTREAAAAGWQIPVLPLSPSLFSSQISPQRTRADIHGTPGRSGGTQLCGEALCTEYCTPLLI